MTDVTSMVPYDDATLDRWVADCIEIGPVHSFLPRPDAYRHFQGWVDVADSPGEEHRRPPGKVRALALMAARLGPPIQRRGRTGWPGLTLAPVQTAMARSYSRLALQQEYCEVWMRVHTRPADARAPDGSALDTNGVRVFSNSLTPMHVADLWIADEGLEDNGLRNRYEAIRAARRALYAVRGKPAHGDYWKIQVTLAGEFEVEKVARAAEERVKAAQALAPWLAAEVEADRRAQATLPALWVSYCQWAEQQTGSRPTDGRARTTFERRLTLVVGEHFDRSSGRVWLALRLPEGSADVEVLTDGVALPTREVDADAGVESAEWLQ